LISFRGSGNSLVISPEGHYRTAGEVESQLVHVVETDACGQLIFTPDEFADRFGLKTTYQK
jgi:hypothetical protein